MEFGIAGEFQDMDSQGMLVQDNRSRRKREGVKESNYHRDNRERSSCRVVLLHNLEAQSLVSLRKKRYGEILNIYPTICINCITLVSD